MISGEADRIVSLGLFCLYVVAELGGKWSWELTVPRGTGSDVLVKRSKAPSASADAAEQAGREAAVAEAQRVLEAATAPAA